MAKKSLFGRIAEALREEEEETAEDIDKDVEAAVAAIAKEKTSSIEADTVLHKNIGKSGDTVFVMDLNPIFAMIGGINSRAATGVVECCDRIFNQHREDPLDRGLVETTKFIMRFAKGGDDEGFRRAVIIINEVGVHVLSDRFKTMEVPDILTAADAGDITNDDGSLNLKRLDATIANGGKTISMGEPADSDPEWVKLRFHKKAQEQQLLAIQKKQGGKTKEPEWIEGIDRSSRRRLKQRSGQDRRRGKKTFSGRDQRGGVLERRGRGY